MKLTANNARFAVVKTAFHNGGTVSFHNSLEAAMQAKNKLQRGECVCGCAAVVPVTFEAQKEIRANGGYYDDELPLYADLPTWDAVSNLSPYQICK